MGEADGRFAGLFHLIWGWGLTVISRKNHLGIHGNKDTVNPGEQDKQILWAVAPGWCPSHLPSKGALNAVQDFQGGLDTSQGAVQP